MILGGNSQALPARIGGRPFWNHPGLQDAIHLDAKIVVKG
jgi:hypothetical protein